MATYVDAILLIPIAIAPEKLVVVRLVDWFDVFDSTADSLVLVSWLFVKNEIIIS